MKTKLELQQEIIAALRTVSDPEINVNIYELGLIYRIDINDSNDVEIDMTMTAPNCPMAEDLLVWARDAVKNIEEVKSVNINLVFDPPWTPSMMSEEAKLELNMF
ncbi:MAG: DUF59 domain-containing protein [Bacteroidales bacterium]|jgi:FeS assembly SUF system protein|nr:DUF59 domain-containing protein [Bacteroidales bacterium]MBQ1719662.1 DUF59 domain-containing protein [Bacteroidales bacterium]